MGETGRLWQASTHTARPLPPKARWVQAEMPQRHPGCQEPPEAGWETMVLPGEVQEPVGEEEEGEDGEADVRWWEGTAEGRPPPADW